MRRVTAGALSGPHRMTNGFICACSDPKQTLAAREESRLRRLARTTGWILLLAVIALSVVPPPLRPITTLPHVVEHAAIYFLAGSAFGLSYPNRFFAWLAGLATFTLAIEVLQLWIPGRHARALDFVVDVSAISVGLAIGMILAQRFKLINCAARIQRARKTHSAPLVETRT